MSSPSISTMVIKVSTHRVFHRATSSSDVSRSVCARTPPGRQPAGYVLRTVSRTWHAPERHRKLARLVPDLIPHPDDVEGRWKRMRTIRTYHGREVSPARGHANLHEPPSALDPFLGRRGIWAGCQSADRDEEHPGERRTTTGSLATLPSRIFGINLELVLLHTRGRLSTVGPTRPPILNPKMPSVWRPPREVLHHAIDGRLQDVHAVGLRARADPRIEGSSGGEGLVVVVLASHHVRPVQVVQFKTQFGEVQTLDKQLRDQLVAAISTQTQNAKRLLRVTLGSRQHFLPCHVSGHLEPQRHRVFGEVADN